MKNLEQYFNDNEVSISETLSFDIYGKMAIVEVKKAISEYMERHHYSEFNFYFSDKNKDLICISLKSEGYETAINLYYEGEYIDSVEDEDDAFNKIQNIVIERGYGGCA